MDKYYGHIDDGNIRIEQHNCCSHSCNNSSYDDSSIKDSLGKLESENKDFNELLGELIERNNELTGRMNSILDNADTNMDSFKEVSDTIKDLQKAIEDIKKNKPNHSWGCDYPSHNKPPHDKPTHECYDEKKFHDYIITFLRDLRFQMNNEYATRSKEIFKLKEAIHKIQTDVKYLDVIKFSKIEEDIVEIKKKLENIGSGSNLIPITSDEINNITENN